MNGKRVWPVPIRFLGILGTLIAVAVLLGTLPLIFWPYADWVAASSMTRESLIYAGPLISGMSAWIAGTYFSGNSMMCPPSAVRSGLEIVISHMTYIVTVSLGAYLLGLLPLLISTALRATVGPPNISVLLSSMALVLVFCSLGYLLGAIVPRLVSTILAITFTFAAIFMVDILGPIISPLRLEMLDAGAYETSVVAIFRTMFFGLIFMCGVFAASKIVLHRSVERRFSAYSGLAILGVPLITAAIARSTAPESVLLEENPPTTCSKVETIEICLHAAKSDLLPELTHVAENLLAVVDSQPAVPAVAVNDSALHRRDAPDSLTLSLQVTESNWKALAAFDIAAAVSGWKRCQSQGGFGGDEASMQLDRNQTVLGFAEWMVQAAGFGSPGTGLGMSPGGVRNSDTVKDKLNSLPVEQARIIYRNSAAELAQCELSSGSIG